MKPNTNATFKPALPKHVFPEFHVGVPGQPHERLLFPATTYYSEYQRSSYYYPIFKKGNPFTALFGFFEIPPLRMKNAKTCW
jgi:hypothetical protein